MPLAGGARKKWRQRAAGSINKTRTALTPASFSATWQLGIAIGAWRNAARRLHRAYRAAHQASRRNIGIIAAQHNVSISSRVGAAQRWRRTRGNNGGAWQAARARMAARIAAKLRHIAAAWRVAPHQRRTASIMAPRAQASR